MSPPIFTPDGSKVSEVILPDGATASKVIAPDGRTVFSPIPDTSMFQNPIVQYSSVSLTLSDGDTVSSWSNQLGPGDVNAESTPEYRLDQSGRSAVFYDDANNDAHNLTNQPAYPTGPGATVSMAATVYVASGGGGGYLGWYGVTGGDGISFELEGGEVDVNQSNSAQPALGISYPTDQWFTMGMALDGGTEWAVYMNDQVDTDSSAPDPSVDDQNHAIAYRSDSPDQYCEVFVNDFVVSGTRESDQAFLDYYNNRI